MTGQDRCACWSWCLTADSRSCRSTLTLWILKVEQLELGGSLEGSFEVPQFAVDLD